jgi:hypothetical protein
MPVSAVVTAWFSDRGSREHPPPATSRDPLGRAYIPAITAIGHMEVTEPWLGATSIVKLVRGALGRQTMLVRPTEGRG